MKRNNMDNTINEEDSELSEGLHEKLNFFVDKGQNLIRIDKFLQNRITYATRNKIQQSIDNHLILVNGKHTKSNYIVKPKDQIIVFGLGEEPSDEIIPENIPIDILFEDKDLILINKPAGMVVHPGCGNYKGTMLNAIAYHWKHKKEAVENLPRLGLVHRIDKNTSGILVLGKNLNSIYDLIKQFSSHSIHRRYIALCWGDLKEDEGTIKAHIGRHQRYRKKFDAYPLGNYGKEAITHYKIIKRFNYVTLVECKLETGRTHQIRVHMKHIGHPLFNDSEYGGNKILKGTVYKQYQDFIEKCFNTCQRHALHAKELGLVHPNSKEKLFFKSKLPSDFDNLISLWNNYINK